MKVNPPRDRGSRDHGFSHHMRCASMSGGEEILDRHAIPVDGGQDVVHVAIEPAGGGFSQ